MSIKVLVADDSITIQKVIGIIFGGDEYSLTVVDNGKAAVDKAREIIPDILLIDALMPGMNGYEVSESVRATPTLAAKPILILTGSFEPFDEEKAKSCGADDFIAKPFESQQIITKVKELLEIGKARELKIQVTPPPSTETTHEIAIEQAAQVVAQKIEVPPVPTSPVQESVAPADIWGAFTPETEPSAQHFAVPVVPAQTVEALEPDVFAIVTEENETVTIQSSSATATIPCHTGSQWIPVEENTFEFEETIAAPPRSTFSEEAPLVEEPSFGDIAFEENTPAPVALAFTASEQTLKVPEPTFTTPAQDFADFAATSADFTPTVTPPEPFAPLADPFPMFKAPVEAVVPPATMEISTVVAPTTNLTEEQLKVALASVSKDVIERIVWEVVPDLAEALIHEAIRKIKEGV